MTTKGAWAIISFHKNDVTKALQTSFPDIGLERTKLWE